MPALSQSLTFTQNSTSTVLLNYPNDGVGPLTYISDREKGDGYYGGSSGFHTIQIQTTNFIGRIAMEASLASEPSSADWFAVSLQTSPESTYRQYSTATTTVESYNFIGNFVWVRAKVSDFIEGTVNSIKYNH